MKKQYLSCIFLQFIEDFSVFYLSEILCVPVQGHRVELYFTHSIVFLSDHTVENGMT